MSTRSLKRIAASVVKALKRHGHEVPHGVVLHGLAAASGEFDWHRLSSKQVKERPSRREVELRGALEDTLACLKNWVEIADEEDLREYDDLAIERAERALAAEDHPAGEAIPVTLSHGELLVLQAAIDQLMLEDDDLPLHEVLSERTEGEVKDFTSDRLQQLRMRLTEARRRGPR